MLCRVVKKPLCKTHKLVTTRYIMYCELGTNLMSKPMAGPAMIGSTNAVTSDGYALVGNTYSFIAGLQTSGLCMWQRTETPL
jgi:hypothetical protein